MYSLQTSVEIGQASFKIRNKGDFRVVLDCFEILHDSTLTSTDKTICSLFVFYEDFKNIQDVIEQADLWEDLSAAMYKFFNGGEDNVESNTGGYNLVDWVKDSNLICSAINSMLRQEIRSMDYLHWWTFLSYYNALGECPFSVIVSIRYKIAKGIKLEKHERKFRQENPEYFNIDFRSEKQKAAEEYVKNLWGG